MQCDVVTHLCPKLKLILKVSNYIQKKSSMYRQVSNKRHTKSQHLKDSRTVLRLSLPNPFKPDVKSRMKM